MNQDELKELLAQFPEAKIYELDGQYHYEHLAPKGSQPISNELRKKLTKNATK